MNVAQLIAILKDYNPERTVIVSDPKAGLAEARATFSMEIKEGSLEALPPGLYVKIQ